MNSNIYGATDIINDVINDIYKVFNSNKMEQTNNVYKIWEEILLSVKSFVTPNYGKNMLDHSKIIDIKDETMIIEVDHTGWMQLFETHKTYLLNGLQKKIPEIKIKNITYKLKKTEEKNTARTITHQEIQEAYDKQDAMLQKNKILTPIKEKKKLPRELEEIFSKFNK